MTLSKVKRVFLLCFICLCVRAALDRTRDQSAQPAPLAGNSGSDSNNQTQPKKLSSNEDLRRSTEKSHHNDVESANPNKKLKEPKANKSVPKNSESATALTRYRDLNGRNREYWQKRIKPLRTKLERLDSQLQTLQAQQEASPTPSGIRVSRRGRWRARSQDTGNSTSRKIDGLKQKRAEVVKSIQEVEDEGRKAQALPEWLR